METLEILNRYNDILKSQGYVQIISDELRLSSQINDKLITYNATASRQNRINTDVSFSKKFELLEHFHTSEKKSDEINEIYSLAKLKQEFENRKISENNIKGKIEFIKSELESLNSDSKLKIMDSNIIYDENRVHFEKIDSLSDFSTKLEKYKLVHKNVYYRGQQNLNWAVLPSIFRGKWIEHESDFVHEMLISNPQDFVNQQTTLEKLTKMQHYNAPTRLLDITSNPYIALYFACEKTSSYSGEVLFFQANENEKYFDSDTISIISNLAMMKPNFDEKKNMPYLLHQIKNERSNFLDIIDINDLHKCFIVHVPMDNKRILNQQGLFLIVGMGKSKIEPASIDDYIFKIAEHRKLIFLIPDSKKKDILKELDVMNINKRFIYPEIDDVADYLKNQKYKQ